MDGFIEAWQSGVMWVCLCALGAMAAWLFLAKVAAPAWDAVRRWWSLPCIQRVIVGVCVVGLSYYGATKQGWHVAYDGGIKAGATANVVTNDTVSIHWQRDTSGGVYVPETAAVYIDYRPNTETNAEWGLLAQTTVGAWGWSGTVENATNYDYNVWAYYIPPEPVHTNGVWTYKTHFDRSGEYALPLRARVEVNGVAIATPAEKRKDAVPTARDYIQDGLVAMWDGIENAGWGVHDPDATTWVDLVNGLVANSSTATPSWTDNSFIGSRTTAFLADGASLIPMIQSGKYSIEVCIGLKRASVNDGGLFSIGSVGSVAPWKSRISLKCNTGSNTAYDASVNTSTYHLDGILYGQQTFAICASVSSFGNYIDGQYKSATKATCAFTPSNNNLYIGRYFYGLAQCDIHCVRLYSRTLTAEEIARNYKIDKERFNLP